MPPADCSSIGVFLRNRHAWQSPSVVALIQATHQIGRSAPNGLAGRERCCAAEPHASVTLITLHSSTAPGLKKEVS